LTSRAISRVESTNGSTSSVRILRQSRVSNVTATVANATTTATNATTTANADANANANMATSSRTYSGLGRRLNSTASSSRQASTLSVGKDVSGSSRFNFKNRIGSVNIEDPRSDRGRVLESNDYGNPDANENENENDYRYGGLRSRTRSGRQSRLKSAIRYE
jgi:hypothetical protein